jgi:hypothetical protein
MRVSADRPAERRARHDIGKALDYLDHSMTVLNGLTDVSAETTRYLIRDLHELGRKVDTLRGSLTVRA